MLELKLRELTSALMAKKVLEAEEGSSGRCAISTVEHFDLICQVLLDLSRKRREIHAAHVKTGVGGTIERMCDFYKQLHTWINGSSMRSQLECQPVTKAYLDALFRPMNLARAVEDPMVVPANVLSEASKNDWRKHKEPQEVGERDGDGEGDCIMADDQQEKKEFGIISLQALWSKTGRNPNLRQINNWRITGTLIDDIPQVQVSFIFL